MNRTQHTPGPWASSPSVSRRSYLIGPAVKDSEGCSDISVVAIVDMRDPLNDQSVHEMTEANARLIAAAPELLAALQGLVDCPDYRAIQTHEMQTARSVIAKAIGQ